MILGWRESFADRLKPRLLAIHSKAALGLEDLHELRAHGLLDEQTGEPSVLGQHLTDLLLREEWQEGDEFEALVQDTLPQPVQGSALDVGCSTGRRIRRLGLASVVRRVGVDVDATALALGCWLARKENQAVTFYCCSAHSLPLPNESFDLVICRNALTYMHHRRALKEMIRVLKPDGLLFVRFENIWFDLQLLVPPRWKLSSLLYARHFLFGLTLAVVGWQPTPGSRLWGWRAFATLRELRRIMCRGGCEIVRVEDSRNCPRFMGHATQTSLLARKSGRAV
jgi:SAM-dependent methyltransferase